MAHAEIRNIALLGLGPHARRIYYPLIEKYKNELGLNIQLVVDLESQGERVRTYMAQHLLQPERLVLLPDSYRNSNTIPEDLASTLYSMKKAGKLDGIIIATEPKSHKAYAKWALENDIDILLDKPITAPILDLTTPESADLIWNDYVELYELWKNSKSNFVVQTQRRNHKGYSLIRNYLKEIISAYRVPISYIDIYHADGMWNMPDEYFYRENHPYKYGYGKLMHSGYHFVDLFSWLTDLNSVIDDKCGVEALLHTIHTTPYDHLKVFDSQNYRELFATNHLDSYFNESTYSSLKNFGEIDVHAAIQLKRDDAVITTGIISLLQNSFSLRGWSALPQDTYKGNGRVRHERVNIQVAGLLNIQIHSYQGYEINDAEPNISGTGNIDHFDIYIFRNVNLIKGKPVEVIRLGENLSLAYGSDTFMGHNELAREEVFLDFLFGRAGESCISTHAKTVKLLSELYRNIIHSNIGVVPISKFNFHNSV
jgi:predicted dehydrogenase